MIEVKGLTKRYGNHTAVSNLTFTVEDNCVYGFLGPNGAGKSTTMNIITGCLSATDGCVSVDGHDIFEEAVEAKKKIGYLPELPPLYFDMTPKEYLVFVSEAKKVPKTEREAQIEEAMEKTGIKAVENKLIKSLSKGYRQRVGIAQAIIGNPSIIILDEPTVGLDPKQIIEIRDLIRELGKTHTVILSSHILSEVQAVCDKILIISNGKLVACDTPEKLETLFAGSKTLKLTVKTSAEDAKRIISETDEIQEIKAEDSGENEARIEITVAKEADIAEKIFFAFAKAGKAIVKMNEETASLEDVFLELTSSEKPKAQQVNAKTSDNEPKNTEETEEEAEFKEGGEINDGNI